MEKRRMILWREIFIAAVAVVITLTEPACSVVSTSNVLVKSSDDVLLSQSINIVFSSGCFTSTKSVSPDENLISDVNILIYNGFGLLEKHIYVNSSNMDVTDDGDYSYPVELLMDCTYSIYVCANTGFKISVKTLSELLAYRFYLAYPDDYRIGVPMSGAVTDLLFQGQETLEIELTRAMAKVSVSVDRSGLNEDVEFEVRSLTVGNCPKSVAMFAPNAVTGTDDTYTVGFSRSGSLVDALNSNVAINLSGEVSLYMLENIQGEPFGEIEDYVDKVIDEGDPLIDCCSYVELCADYLSDEYYSQSKGLIYRFYLGDSASDFSVERNCHYHVTICPQGTGLEGDGWRVDKDDLAYCGEAGLYVTPSGAVVGYVGDSIHVQCTVIPRSAPFDIGLEELEWDKSYGIYDYVIDDDGYGVTLNLLSPGTGILYFEAGEPINDAEMLIVVVLE